MPKIRRRNVPPRLFDHLLDRISERETTADQLGLSADWLITEPKVPEGQWFKCFPEMIVCGAGQTKRDAVSAVVITLREEIADNFCSTACPRF